MLHRGFSPPNGGTGDGGRWPLHSAEGLSKLCGRLRCSARPNSCGATHWRLGTNVVLFVAYSRKEKGAGHWIRDPVRPFLGGCRRGREPEISFDSYVTGRWLRDCEEPGEWGGCACTFLVGGSSVPCGGFGRQQRSPMPSMGSRRMKLRRVPLRRSASFLVRAVKSAGLRARARRFWSRALPTLVSCRFDSGRRVGKRRPGRVFGGGRARWSRRRRMHAA